MINGIKNSRTMSLTEGGSTKGSVALSFEGDGGGDFTSDGIRRSSLLMKTQAR
jgi:hypothetical protein